MSRRCRATLFTGTATLNKEDRDFDSGSDCIRTGNISSPGLPCTEPLIYSTNLLGSGFEQVIAATGGGPNGDEIPYAESTFGTLPYKWPSTDGVAISKRGTTAPFLFVQNTASGTLPQWKISTVNPDTGTYHARATGNWQTTDVRGPDDIVPVIFIPCVSWIPTFPLWRVGPSDLVFQSIRAMVQAVTANVEQILLHMDFLDSEGNFIGGTITKSGFLTTAYQSFSQSVFAPPGAHYMSVRYRMARANPGTAVVSTFDFDNPILSIGQAGTDVLICSQAGLITIDNSTTETDFL